MPLVIDSLGSMEATVEMPAIKQIMRNVAEALPEDATWDDVDYELDFVKIVWAGLRRPRDEEGVTHAEMKQRLGIE